MRDLRFVRFAMAATLLGITGCGLAPLSEEQEKRFQQVTASMGRAFSLSAATAQQRHLTVQMGGDEDQDLREMSHLMTAALKAGNCEIPRPVPEISISPDSGPKKVDFVIRGKECPIHFSLKATIELESQSETMQVMAPIELSFRANTPDIRDILTVRSIEASGLIQMISQVSGEQIEVVAEHQIKGTLDSTVEGRVEIELNKNIETNVDLESGQGVVRSSVSLTTVFNDFTARLQSSINMDSGERSDRPSIEADLNGKSLTPEDYFKLYKDALGPFSQ